MAKKRYNADGRLVCLIGGYRRSFGLSTIYDIKAETKLRAEGIARRIWRRRNEMPTPRACKAHLSVEEAY